MKARVLEIDWKRPGVRKVAAVLVFAAAALAQYFLANMPLQADVAVVANGRFQAASIEPGQRLVIQGPMVDSSQGWLLSHRGSTNEMIDVYADQARLSPETLELLRGQPHVDPPVDWQHARYITEGDHSQGEVGKCRPEFEVRLQPDSSSPAEIQLFQSQPLGMESNPYLELKVTGRQLAVRSIAFPGDDAGNCGYHKLLKLGDWEQPISPSVGVSLVVAAGSALRVYFRPMVSNASYDGSGGRMLALALGSAPDRAEDAAPFRARAVRIEPLQTRNDSPAILSASTREGEPPLTLSKLGVSSDRLLIGVTGKGHVEENGKEATYNGLDRVKSSGPLETLLATANGGLTTWVVSVFVRRRKKTTPRSKGARERNTSPPAE